MDRYEAKYGIYVDIITFQIFEKNRQHLGISASEYLKNLMSLDYSGDIILEKPIPKRRIDLKQSRLYRSEDLKPDLKLE